MIIQRRSFLASMVGLFLVPFTAGAKPPPQVHAITPDQPGHYWFEGIFYGKELSAPVYVGRMRWDGKQRLVHTLQSRQTVDGLYYLSPATCISPDLDLKGTYTKLEKPRG